MAKNLRNGAQNGSRYDQLAAMRAFARVVESGSFTRAATILAMPKATATKLIQTLEADLQVTLLHRTTRRVSVTPDGAQISRTFVKSAGRLKTSTETVTCATCTPRTSTKTYDALGFPDRVADATGVMADHNFDSAGRLTRLSEGRVLQSDYQCPTGSTPNALDYGANCGGRGSCWSQSPFDTSKDGALLGYAGWHFSCPLQTATPAIRTTTPRASRMGNARSWIQAVVPSGRRMR